MNRAFLMACVAICALSAPASAQDVGVMAAINRDVTGERPAEPPRTLVLNERLISNERVTTSASGGGQVLFLDQTSLTLSPNSDIILDRYVYDPERQTGELSVSMLKGAMRLVGGRITKSSAATIRTPSATIGIRGGIASTTVEEDGSTLHIHVAGLSSTVTTAEGTVTVTREGGAVQVPAPEGGVDEAGFEASGEDDVGGASEQTGDAGAETGGETGGQTGGAGGFGTAGGEPEFIGVAPPEVIETAFDSGTGVGNGGITEPVTPEAVDQRIEPIEIEVSRADDVIESAPISTEGEREAETFSDPPPLAEPPEEEVAEDNIAENIEDELVQILDGIEFNGAWRPVVGLADGNFAFAENNLRYEMKYSLTDAQGIVVVELPNASDLSDAQVQSLFNGNLRGDRFIVVGDEDLNIVGDANLLSNLGGDASDVALIITTDDEARGAIFIDYSEAAGLPNIDFVDGEIVPVKGKRVDGRPTSEAVNRRRNANN